MTTTPGTALRAVRVAVREAIAAGVTPVEILDAAGGEIFRPESLEDLGLTHPGWDEPLLPCGCPVQFVRDCGHREGCENWKRTELRARLARHDREALSPGGRRRGW